MRQKLILFLTIFYTTISFAQNDGWNGDTGIGGAFSTGNFKGYGAAANLEGNYFINENLSIGGRFEVAYLFKGKVIGAPEGVFKNSFRAALLIKTNYYFGQGDIKPYFGLVAGYFDQTNHTNTTDDGFNFISYGYDKANSFGFGPEVGIRFNGGFKVYGIFHYIPSNGVLSNSSTNPNVPETIEISRNYFTININFPMPVLW